MLDYQQIFGQRLTRALEIREIDINGLHEKTGINKKTLYTYRAGERPPSYHNLVAIGKTLHVSLDWMCGMRVKE